MSSKTSLMTVAGLGICLSISAMTWSNASAVAAPDVSFGFEGTFSGSGGELTISATCPVNLPGPCVSSSAFGSQSGDGYWEWTSESDRGGGFIVDTTSKLTGTYTILLKFSFNDVDGYRKVIDFSDRNSDNGLYIEDNFLGFYSFGGSTVTEISEDEVITMVVTRSSDGTVSIYTLSGGTPTLEFSFSDALADEADDAIPVDSGSGSRLNFFVDDSGTESTKNGRVYDLRMWAGQALTEEEIATLADGGSAFNVDVGGLLRGTQDTNQAGLPRTGPGTSSSLVTLASMFMVLGIAALTVRSRRPALTSRR